MGCRVAGRTGGREGGTTNKQEVRGKVKRLKGRTKETIGIVSGNRTLERDGARQRAEGALQESLGTARQKVGEVLKGIPSAIKK